MGKCIYSHGDGAYCDRHDHGAVTVGCCGEGKCPDRKALTNADRIRCMTDEELAEWFSIYCCRNKTYDAHCTTFANCKDCWLDWLHEEAKE